MGNQTLPKTLLLKTALIIGASGGIGSGIARNLLATSEWQVIATYHRQLPKLEDPKLIWHPLDVTHEASVEALMTSLNQIDLLIQAAGTLASEHYQPEKTIRRFSPDQLAHSIAINTTPFLLTAKYARRALSTAKQPKVVALSARVGSITDNQLGGWYSYRISKAALNMAVKTVALEWRHALPDALVIAYHPGTVQTPLSAPFHRPTPTTLTPDDTAHALLALLSKLNATNTGTFWDWQGLEVPW